ncbi:50S ribosomal protein L11 methyltransferase [Geopsychrobacter electrodiphilus]|uniref:50S ribosomal protein L11 methyltransferase n=1 Tax=Geopsychrobacter electrodiphilus TaxID=225196 RepID=UPI0003717DFB|nr:50S ribosomal protein L11 methyltransferase [Geopsychrobacter electrodiphilus]
MKITTEPEKNSAGLGRTDFRPLDIGRALTVLPPGEIAARGRIPLWMERGAFGSGEHETTHNCLELLSQLTLSPVDKILDLGSGTGILSIAALLLGAGRAWCVDIEQGAIAACQRNAVLNGVEENIEHCQGTLSSLGQGNFDLGLANIYGDILLQVADDLASRIRPGGKLLLSGMLWEYNFDVRSRYQKLGYQLLENRMHTEFSTMLLQRQG